MLSLMANCFTWVKQRREPSKKVTLLMVGLDNAGKTSTVADLTGESTDGIVPTIGFQNSSFSLYKFQVTLFDVGGGPRIRSIWKIYYADCYGIVFVVDASDADRLEESKKILHETEAQPRVSGKPLLILGNKQDREGALNESELRRKLELDKLTQKHKCPCQVFCCTAVLGKENKVDKQIKKGFRWLLSEVSKDFENISRRVEKDLAEQKKEQDVEKALRKERLRKVREEREKAEREAAAAEKAKQVVEDSDDGVVAGKDKKERKGRKTPEQETSLKKKKKQREMSPENEEPGTTERKKKKKRKPKNEAAEEMLENATAGEETPHIVSPIESPRDDRVRTPGESSASLQPDLQNRISSPTNENFITPANGEVKQKKKKKRRRKLNKTVPLDEENYRLPPLNAWDAPTATLNGLPGSSGVSPRRLEPLGPPRGQGISSSAFSRDDGESNFLPPLRTTWTRSKPNSEDDVVT